MQNRYANEFKTNVELLRNLVIPAFALIFTHIFRTMLDFKGFLVCLR